MASQISAKRERLADHRVDQGVQVVRAITLGGVAGHQDDPQRGVLLPRLEGECDAVESAA